MINGYTPDFLEFYERDGNGYPGYPLKKGKMDGQKAWNQLKSSKMLPEVTILKTCLLNQIKEKQVKFNKNEWTPLWPLPASWIRGCRWEDEVELPELAQVLSIEEKRAKLYGSKTR